MTKTITNPFKLRRIILNEGRRKAKDIRAEAKALEDLIRLVEVGTVDVGVLDHVLKNAFNYDDGI